MKTRTLLLSSALLLGACGPQMGDEFRAGIPTEDNVKLNVPARAGQALSEGKESDFYNLTRGVTSVVNGGTAWVLGLVREVTRHAPTSIDGDTAVWGPHAGALDKNAWKLTVTRVADGVHEYKLEGKAKTADDSAFVTILTGKHTAAKDAAGQNLENFGSGTFTVDWDAAATLPDHGRDMGKGLFTYARPSASDKATVAVDFRQVHDEETDTRIDVDYRYEATPNEGGQFDFAVFKPQFVAGDKVERLSVRSRWTEAGAGRADVRLTGGDLTGEASATVNECWDAGFISRFSLVSFAPGNAEVNYGTDAESCAIHGESYFAE